MTSPDPNPDQTVGLESGSGVEPGDVPPIESSTSESSSSPASSNARAGTPESRAGSKTWLFVIIAIVAIIVIAAVIGGISML